MTGCSPYQRGYRGHNATESGGSRTHPAILEHFEHLQELDTEDIPPTATVLPLRSVMREDEPRVWGEREGLLENAPDAEDGCFKVPPVLE
jgi:aspartyl/glutamyl-tRNA(Asn/Gln) amidotransferase C subunit